MMRGYYGGIPFDRMFGFGCVAFIVGLLILAAITVFVVLLIIKLSHNGRKHAPYTSQPAEVPASHAVEILNTRLAKGEITIDEYKALKEELQKPI